ncbi:MAG: PRC-barrel domain-containing protein [Dehalococcoidia bacterium]
MVDMAMLDNLRHGAPVISTDGDEVGKLHTILLDGRDEHVTRIVVNAGPHFPAPGFGAPDLIAVPIEEMVDAHEGQVVLKCTREKFRQLPPFSEWQSGQAPAPQASGQAHRSITDIAIAVANSFASIGGLAVPMESFRRAQFERHLFNDAPVWRDEPHEKIGEVEHVLVDELDEEIEALVVRRGEILGENVILPVHYVVEVFGGIVRVHITDDEIEALEPYDAR